MNYLQAHFLMVHFYIVCKVAGGGICLVFFHSPRMQLWAEIGSLSRLCSGQDWPTGENPPVFSWKYIISFIISSLLHSSFWPWILPPHLLHLNFKWKAFNGVQKTTSPSLETDPWFLLEFGIPHPSILLTLPICGAGIVMQVWGTS